MDRQRIQNLLDNEKPVFDLARMLLTTIAWWSLLIFLGSIVHTKGLSTALVFSAPILGVGALFGLVLIARLNFVIEAIGQEMITAASADSRWVRWPILIVAAIMPIACAWIIVWSLMFARLPQ